MTDMDKPNLAVSRIREILEDDTNNHTDLLKLGSIWHACMDAADYNCQVDIEGYGVVNVKAHD